MKFSIGFYWQAMLIKTFITCTLVLDCLEVYLSMENAEIPAIQNLLVTGRVIGLNRAKRTPYHHSQWYPLEPSFKNDI